MYDSLRSIILEWISTPIMFPSHTASYLKCTTVLLLAVLNGLSELTPAATAHEKAFNKGISNVLVWEDTRAWTPLFLLLHSYHWLGLLRGAGLSDEGEDWDEERWLYNHIY